MSELKLVKLCGHRADADKLLKKLQHDDYEAEVQKTYTVRYQHGERGKRGWAVFEIKE